MTELDELMSRDPLELSEQDIEKIVTYHRHQRARKASGEKPTKPTVDLSGILNKLQFTKPEASSTIKRRI